MSKEQTPITAEEFILHSGYEECCDYLPPSKISPLMEQYAQAKVLEALEREVPKAWRDFKHNTGTEYYETEVKPKYKL